MIEKIIDSFKLYSERNAFYIKDKYYSYGQVAQKVSDIRSSFKQCIPGLDPKYIGVMIYDDLESYCSCISVLLSGCGYVPLSPYNPTERNLEIIVQSDLKIILSSEKTIVDQLNLGQSLNFIFTRELPSSPVNLDFPICKDEDPAYVIFTSGSTGKPKGTPISRGNLNAFLDSVWHLGWKISKEDRFLQMSSMTFDMSIITFIIPLCIGACIYTVPEDEIKYLFGYKLMDEMKITFSAVVPSTIAYLRPYFPEINLPALRYSLVCGEAFPIEFADNWSSCAPNAEIINIYGPTEATVFTHSYHYKKGLKEKAYNDIMAIGELVKNMDAMLIDEAGNQVAAGDKGELCISGKQLTNGYLKSVQKNNESFFILNEGGIEKRFYKTGDIVFEDKDETFYYVGRTDNQVKIQGFRVELGDIEKHVRDFIDFKPAVALATRNRFGNQQINLIVEKNNKKREEIMEYLNSKLPNYMIPSDVTEIERMPLNTNGKIDRSKLANSIYITNPK